MSVRIVHQPFVRRTLTCSACPSRIPPGCPFCGHCIAQFPMLLKLVPPVPWVRP